VDQWIDFLPALAAGPGFPAACAYVDSYLALRTVLVGHQLSIADLLIWGHLKSTLSRNLSRPRPSFGPADNSSHFHPSLPLGCHHAIMARGMHHHEAHAPIRASSAGKGGATESRSHARAVRAAVTPMLAVVIKGGKNPHLARWFDFCSAQPHIAVRPLAAPRKTLTFRVPSCVPSAACGYDVGAHAKVGTSVGRRWLSSTARRSRLTWTTRPRARAERWR